MKTYEDQVKEWASGMKMGGCKIMVADDNTLIFVVMDSAIKIKNLRESTNMTTTIKYDCDTKKLLFNITPLEAELENGVTAIVDFGNKYIDDILIKLTQGIGKVEFYSVSEDISNISCKGIPLSQMSRGVLKMELEKAGLIK